MIYYCAYNFPAVLLCYGPDKWSELRGVYLSMANERDKKVKKSLASSIAEIANLLDTQTVEKDLLQIFDKFYKDERKIITLNFRGNKPNNTKKHAKIFKQASIEF